MPKTARAAKARSTTAALPGPASLTHPEARRGVACRSCGSDRVTQIGMTLTDGSKVQFAFCRVCEHRTWVEDDAPVAFNRVLDKTRKIA
jgi:transcription elongation factor Elf1